MCMCMHSIWYLFMLNEKSQTITTNLQRTAEKKEEKKDFMLYNNKVFKHKAKRKFQRIKKKLLKIKADKLYPTNTRTFADKCKQHTRNKALFNIHSAFTSIKCQKTTTITASTTTKNRGIIKKSHETQIWKSYERKSMQANWSLHLYDAKTKLLHSQKLQT